MPSEPPLLERIAALAGFGRYRLRLHAARHMLEEGFEERNIIEALTGRGRKILEEYPEQHRSLQVFEGTGNAGWARFCYS